MASRTAFLAIPILILLSSSFAPNRIHAAYQDLQLELGYGLTTLVSVSSGVPVYTIGDTFWALSNFNGSVSGTLASPNSATTVHRNLETGIPVPIHQFTTSDVEGTWSFRLLLSNHEKFFIPVHFVKPSDHSPKSSPYRYSLDNDKVRVGFDISSADVYDEEACLLTKQTEGLAAFHMPQAVGAGDIGIRRVGNSLIVGTNASIKSTFAFWLELYHPYSFNINGTTEFVSRSMRAATSIPIIVSSAGQSNTSLGWEANPRIGRYEARAFFENSSGSIFVAQERILVPDYETWLSLDSCQVNGVNSSSAAYTASLKGNPVTWPTGVFLMYRVSGVESASLIPLSLHLSKVTFVAEPWETPVDDLQIKLDPNLSLGQYALVNGTMYILAKSYPMHLSFSVAIKSHFVPAGVVDFTMPYSIKQAPLSLGKIAVHVLNQEAPSAGVAVRLTDRYNETILGTTGTNAYANFFVPAGTYNVTATLAGQSSSARVAVSAGQETVLNMELQTAVAALPESLASLQQILAITAAIGLAVNIFVWVVRPRLSRASG